MTEKKWYGRQWCFIFLGFLAAGILAFIDFNVCIARASDPVGGLEPYPAAKAPFYKLIKNKKPLCVIVLDSESDATEKYASIELCKYIEKITNADLEIVPEPKDDSYPIYLGKAGKKRLNVKQWTQLGPDGFVLKSNNGGIIISGNESLGTLYGTFQFIEKHLGVRWFMPGEIGEVVPRAETLQVGTFEETEIPSFRVRWISSGDWALRHKMNVCVNVGDRPVGINWKYGFHSFLRLIPPETYYEEHPEWFSMIKGKRPRPKPNLRDSQLCTSNPELIEEVAKNIINIFDDDASIDIISLCPQDGGGFCGCPQCRALDRDHGPDRRWHGRYSDRLAVFNNAVAKRVAKKYPDKLIKVGAYAKYMRVPKIASYKPACNLAIQACHTYSCNNHRVAMPTCERNTTMFSQELRHWSKLTNHLFIYEYYRKGVWGGLPYCQVHVIREDIPYYHRIGAEGFYTQPAGSQWPACGLNHYIAAKLLWNVELDVDKLLEDFYKKFYGEAAEPMRDYYESLERAFDESNTCLSPFGLKWPTLTVFDFFTPEVVAAVDAAVTRAELMAKTEIIQKRITLIRVRVEWVRKMMNYLRVIRSPFKNINLKEPKAVAKAHKKAIALGEPLSKKLEKFCRKNDIVVFDRHINAHKRIEFIIEEAERVINRKQN